MYHKVTADDKPDHLTVSTSQLEKQFKYLQQKRYTPVFISDLVAWINDGKSLPRRPILLTFDDGYQNNFTQLYPLLQQYRFKANIFLVAGFIRNGGVDDAKSIDFLHIGDIRQMDKQLIQFGLHSFDHKSYNDLSIEQIEEDIRMSRSRLDELGVEYQPCFAYTYGAYPRKDAVKRKAMYQLFGSFGIQLAMRIGNRLNRFPIKNKFLLKRIDVRGNESFLSFRFSLAGGRKLMLK